MRPLSYFLAVVILSLIGCRTPERANQSPEKDIISGIRIFGSHKYWTDDKIIALKAAVAALDDRHPIISIKFIDAKTAEVTTGIVRGPLDGSGRIYTFLFKDGKWITDRSSTSIWVS